VPSTGYPTSSNRASSFHLRWGGLPPAAPIVEVAATLEVVVPPAVPELYFWALQASFLDGGRERGGAHLGLQWYPVHPGSTAVNWGGYDRRGRVLPGTSSPLPSATGNPNTRDWTWSPGTPVRLVVRAAGPGEWAGLVDGTEVRRLRCGGDRLGHPMVWSEVFARCDDPAVAVRWSRFEATTADGTVLRPDRGLVTYQSGVEGGCTNTTVLADGDGVLQVTAARREVPAGTVLRLG
jgi:hypothetical protein